MALASSISSLVLLIAAPIAIAVPAAIAITVTIIFVVLPNASSTTAAFLAPGPPIIFFAVAVTTVVPLLVSSLATTTATTTTTAASTFPASAISAMLLLAILITPVIAVSSSVAPFPTVVPVIGALSGLLPNLGVFDVAQQGVVELMVEDVTDIKPLVLVVILLHREVVDLGLGEELLLEVVAFAIFDFVLDFKEEYQCFWYKFL